jgi:hypothetical protein
MPSVLSAMHDTMQSLSTTFLMNRRGEELVERMEHLADDLTNVSAWGRGLKSLGTKSLKVRPPLERNFLLSALAWSVAFPDSCPNCMRMTEDRILKTGSCPLFDLARMPKAIAPPCCQWHACRHTPLRVILNVAAVRIGLSFHYQENRQRGFARNRQRFVIIDQG